MANPTGTASKNIAASSARMPRMPIAARLIGHLPCQVKPLIKSVNRTSIISAHPRATAKVKG